MKKQVISIAVAITLGVSNPVKAFIVGGIPDSSSLQNFFGWSSSSKKTSSPQQKATPPQQKKMPPVTPLIDILKKQLEETKKIHESITGSQKFDTSKLKNIPTDQTSFFLKTPELVYYQNNGLAISKALPNILQGEEIPTSIRESRDFIGKRIQYATAIDKAVSLQTFQETENRFNQISELVEKINTTTDLKSIAELQARIKGMLAMIQNEATKLQMVTYSRNAEQALINQQKQIRNMRILNSENKGMPIIRSIR
ncbi:hypothetical protein ME7_00958 [Bartonella birtlesii LL-WM9]|uniref:P-type DNA transfer protein VirB5 n=1 Tax=Bartonella birtlesii LL-WM9 TaxID=1094552 RepID=J0Q1L1_9HYPH|nr:type IV secrection system protein TrwJ [Bartonella birtlesii]EJF76414.1 hypothetical protein ME7_00958 [Bartonella birtlesii LL-WM9]